MNNHHTNDSQTQDPSGLHEGVEIEISPDRTAHWMDLELSDVLLARLRSRSTHSTHALARLESLGLELASTLENTPRPRAVGQFLREAATYQEALDRLATVHTIEQLEGRRRMGVARKSTIPAIPWPGWTDPQDPHRLKRLLTDLEFGLVRHVALTMSGRHAAVVGIAEAGAATGEMPDITSDRVDVAAGQILLPGGVDGLEERVATLPQWAAEEICELATNYQGTSQCIVYGGEATERHKIQSSIAMNTLKVFKHCGLRGDPAVSFSSLRFSAARAVYDTAGTDAAVRFLGESNYENARLHIGLRPMPPARR